MKEIILGNLGFTVDLSSYSRSPGFYGYFEYEDTFSKVKVNKAIQLFSGFWEAVCEDCVSVVHNLAIEDSLENLIENYEYTSKEIDEYIIPLVNKGILRFEDTINSDLAGDNFITLKFCRNDAQDLYRLLFVIMALGGVDGHLFVVFENKDLILYPHDECGFGAISEVINNEWVDVLFNLVRNCGGFSIKSHYYHPTQMS